MTCHDPHQSNGPKLIQKFATHALRRQDSCDTCHAAPKDGKVVLTQTDSKALCVTCHEEQAKKIETAKVQHPGAQGDCIDCHNPHAGKTPGFIKPDAGERLPGLPRRPGRAAQKEASAPAGFRAGLRDLPRASRRRQPETAPRQERQRALHGVPRSRCAAHGTRKKLTWSPSSTAR